MIKRHPWLALTAFYLLLLGGGWWMGQVLPMYFGTDSLSVGAPEMRWGVIAILAVYVLVSALPFVPGAEIGFAFIMLFGGDMAVLVYLGMITALSLAFLAGCLLPLRLAAAVFETLHLRRAHEFILMLGRLNGPQRLALLTENAPGRVAPVLLRHRYLFLAAILNIPGNSLVGGGGGIGFIAGLSGVYSPARYVATILIAVIPVPLFFYLTQ